MWAELCCPECGGHKQLAAPKTTDQNLVHRWPNNA